MTRHHRVRGLLLPILLVAFVAIGLLVFFTYIEWLQIIWRAYNAGGTVTVGDNLAMLRFELFIVAPLIFAWFIVLTFLMPAILVFLSRKVKGGRH